MHFKILLGFSLLIHPIVSSALDIENGKRINNTCALCHGIYGQGTPGTLSPRLAGLSADYLAKELKFYRSGKRNYPAMTVTSQINTMTDKDIQDISEYLAGINLRNLNLPKIPDYEKGDPAIGKKVFMKNCKSCHRRTGLGKIKKGIPPLAGQYGSYIYSQMNKFKTKNRYHDDDPEDDIFDDFSDDDLHNLIAFITDLPIYPDSMDGLNVRIAAKPEPKEDKAGIGKTEDNKLEKAILTASMPASDENNRVQLLQTGDVISLTTLTDEKESQDKQNNEIKIAGKFRITATGEIILNPTVLDLRRVAGTSGEFKITPSGIVFIPNQITN